MRLVTLNIAHGRGLGLYQGFTAEHQLQANLERIGAFLRDSGADIVALQEVDEDSHWTKGVNLLETLREISGIPHAFLGVNNRRAGPKQLAYGNAILSRYDVHNWENLPFGTAQLGEKGFQFAVIETEEGSLPIINLHLDYRSRQRRLNQVDQIIQFLRDREHPGDPARSIAPIICGDFNTSARRAEDAVSHLLGFLASQRHYNILPERKRTFPAQLPQRALDYVFLPAPFVPLRCEVVKAYLSDHRPVLLEFQSDVCALEPYPHQ